MRCAAHRALPLGGIEEGVDGGKLMRRERRPGYVLALALERDALDTDFGMGHLWGS